MRFKRVLKIFWLPILHFALGGRLQKGRERGISIIHEYVYNPKQASIYGTPGHI